MAGSDSNTRRKKSPRAAGRPRTMAADAGIASGRNQSGLRNYNERVILSLVRKRGALPKSEIAAETGLSAQAITVIINQLEADCLLVRQSPQRGRVGQPSVPFALNPGGAFAYGLKVGRRSFDLTLLDLVGNVLGALHENCAYPTVDQLTRFMKKGLAVLVPDKTADAPRRLAGIGVAMPDELWNWSVELEAPEAVMNQWRHFDIKAGLAQLSTLPVYVCNDDTAACAAELLFGNPGNYQDFLYIYIGSFVGGGVVINGNLYPGRRGNAGAIGSLPVPALLADGQVGSQQLIMQASIRVLEKMLKDSGKDPQTILNSYDYWGNPGPVLDLWQEKVATALAYAAVSAISLIDFEAVIVDGHIPVSVRHQIVEQLKQKLELQDFRGLSSVTVGEGTIGTRAQSIGSASLPFLVEFGEDSQLSFQSLR